MAARRKLQLFAYWAWDAAPVFCALLQGAYLAFLVWIFPRVHWWAMIPLCFLYSIAISWNINGIAHNFIHNPHFASAALNRLFSIYESLVNLAGQVFYHSIHMRHHQGNSDRRDEHGQTIDWLFIGLFMYNWKFVLFFLPFFYLGNCLSYLNSYYKHFGGDPHPPVAWGVSTYGRIYSRIWFNNGYHAEHHYRPRVHWTKMKELHQQIEEEMRQANTCIIHHAHALGFLERDLRERAPMPEPASAKSPSSLDAAQPLAQRGNLHRFIFPSG